MHIEAYGGKPRCGNQFSIVFRRGMLEPMLDEANFVFCLIYHYYQHKTLFCMYLYILLNKFTLAQYDVMIYFGCLIGRIPKVDKLQKYYLFSRSWSKIVIANS